MTNHWKLFGKAVRFTNRLTVRPSHFGSRTFLLKHCIAFACGEVFCWLYFCILVRRRIMPRRGWVTAPDGWVQIIRGPHPPAERWPKLVRAASAGASKPWQQVQGQAPVGRWRQSEKPRSSVPPEVTIAAAKKRVGGLESTVQKCKS